MWKFGCFLALREPWLVHFCVAVCELFRVFSIFCMIAPGRHTKEHPNLVRQFVLALSWLKIPIVQYRPRALQHLHARKLRAIWRFYTQNPRKKLACKFLHEFLHANLRVFLRWLILLVINTRKLCVFLYISKRQQPMMADVKLETVIVEKRLFAVYIPIVQLYVTNKVSRSYYKSFQRKPPPPFTLLLNNRGLMFSVIYQ